MGDIIKQMIDGIGDIARVLTGHGVANKYEIIFEQEQAEQLLRELMILLNEGEICRAEDLLFKELEKDFTEEKYQSGLQFYEQLKKLDNNYLLSHNFSCEEINQGIKSLNKFL